MQNNVQLSGETFQDLAQAVARGFVVEYTDGDSYNVEVDFTLSGEGADYVGGHAAKARALLDAVENCEDPNEALFEFCRDFTSNSSHVNHKLTNERDQFERNVRLLASTLDLAEEVANRDV